MSKLLLTFGFALSLFSTSALAQEVDKKIKFNYTNTDIRQVITDYAKESGQKIIIDPAVQGKISIINPQPITLSEAFNQLCSALAINGIGYSEQENVMSIRSARSLQRDNIPTVVELPPIRPERMVTYIVTLKHISAEEVNKQLRILSSKDGELVPFLKNNQLILTDWISNLHRVDKIIKRLDVKLAPQPAAGTGGSNR